ncbi:MAG: DNA polymerase, partial [Anaerolineales bacterium]
RGYVKTILGRRRRFNLWGPRKYEVGLRPLPYDEAVEKWGKYVVRYFTYRAGNSVIQGSAADMMKRAMVDVYMATGIVPALTIHDELIISRPPGTIRADLAEVRRLMEEAIPLLVPVPTDAEIGTDLGNMEKV